MRTPFLIFFFCIFSPFAFGQTDLFGTDDILELRLKGPTQTLFNDRGDNAIYHKMDISYTDEEGEIISIPLKVKTRGNFRRDKSNCYYPPLRLNFSKTKTPPNTLFTGQDKIKLVTPCRDQKYVIREYLVYKLYNLLTPLSFNARLVRVIYDDPEKEKRSDPLYGILLEDKEQMAARNQSKNFSRNKVRPNKTEKEVFLKMAVFEYLIGNTDWSVQYQHNVKLIVQKSSIWPTTVPYDFDHAGIVRAPYARPAEALQLRSIQERRYRGYCVADMKEFESVFADFNRLKPAIYRLYTENPLLDTRYISTTVKFLDGFYETINNRKARLREFRYPCDKNGTGNVIIRGLNE